MTTATGSVLVLDLGNSRLKAMLVEPVVGAERRAEVQVFERSAGLEAELERWLATRARPSLAALSSVASDAERERLEACLRRHVDGPLLSPPASGLTLDVRCPETVGLDRLFAARGALEYGAQLIVVDAGTAVTVDAVEGGASARFLGGAIAPGPALLARALCEGGARLPAFEPWPETPALGKETRDALRAGVAVGFEGTVLHLVERIAAELGWEAPTLVLTGGAAAFLRTALARSGRALIEDERLVLRGIALAALAGAASGGGTCSSAC